MPMSAWTELQKYLLLGERIEAALFDDSVNLPSGLGGKLYSPAEIETIMGYPGWSLQKGCAEKRYIELTIWTNQRVIYWYTDGPFVTPLSSLPRNPPLKKEEVAADSE